MNRDSRRYPNREIYKDVFKYGYENFDFEVLEECNKESLLEREQYYYDQILPEYNEFKPVENLFEDPDFRQFLVDANRKNEEMHKQRKSYIILRNIRKIPNHGQQNETSRHV